MLKLKLTAIIGVLSLVGFILHNSHTFSATAENDAIEEIAKYKTWTRISKDPIAVKIDESAFVGG